MPAIDVCCGSCFIISPYSLREEAEAREEKARLDGEQAKVGAIETDKKKVSLECDCGFVVDTISESVASFYSSLR